MSEPPFVVRGIDHIVLRVRALAPALSFYRDVLGCPVEREQPELGLTQLRAGHSLIDLVSADGPLGRATAQAQGPNLDHFCLAVAPFQEPQLLAWLAARGIPGDAPAPRYGAQGEGRSFYIADPDGNRIELKGAAAPGREP
jgi:catechol 2,3-dioxygenase-like lactoylglutathione lyase family enzyme